MADDLHWMQLALEQARIGAAAGEVPVGAVAVLDGRLIAAAHNIPIGLKDPTAHAEILALRNAARELGAYRLPGLDLFVTLEPCMMCFGAMLHARVRRLVYAAPDPKVGFSRLYAMVKESGNFNHSLIIESGLMETESAELLRDFFRERRRSSAES